MSGIKLTPIYLYLYDLGYNGDQIENLTLKQLEDILNDEYEHKCTATNHVGVCDMCMERE